MFCEETFGKIKLRAFSKRVGPEFFRLKALITLEQVNTTECRINCLLISRSNLQASETDGRCKSVLVFRKKTNSGSKTQRVMEEEQHTAKLLNGK